MCEPSQKISGYFVGKSTTGYINGAFACKELIFKLLTSDMLMVDEVKSVLVAVTGVLVTGYDYDNVLWVDVVCSGQDLNICMNTLGD